MSCGSFEKESRDAIRMWWSLGDVDVGNFNNISNYNCFLVNCGGEENRAAPEVPCQRLESNPHRPVP